MSIIINKHGHIMEEFINVESKEELDKIIGISGGHAVLFYNGQLILCHNKFRGNWELPGGGKEKDEDLIQCVKREIGEEISQDIEHLQIRGVSRVFIPRMNKEILWAVFYSEVKTLKPFVENEEMSKIVLWDMKTDIGDIDEVDLKIIEFVLTGGYIKY
jgi:8-oxo-dGTP diphosphatase